MKNNMKKFSVLLLALVMMMSMLAACGGGGTSDSGSEEAETEATVEPNSGVSGVVFTVPDDWKLTYASEGNVGYKTADEKATFWAGTITEETLKEIKEYSKDVTAENVEAYYESLNDKKEELEKNNAEMSPSKIAEWEAMEEKTNNEAGECVALYRRWLYDGVMYGAEIVTSDYRDNKGEVNKNATALSEENLATFESVLTTIKSGDGNTLLMSKVDPTSIGNFSFEPPEGFTLRDYSESYISFAKEGSKTTMSVSRTTQEDVDSWKAQDENAPATIQEQFNNRIYEGMETTTIAECEAFKMIDDNTYEDGNVYTCEAGFLADDAVYSMYLETDAWGEDGLKDDAVPTTEEEREAFKKFVDSFKKK